MVTCLRSWLQDPLHLKEDEQWVNIFSETNQRMVSEDDDTAWFRWIFYIHCEKWLNCNNFFPGPKLLPLESLKDIKFLKDASLKTNRVDSTSAPAERLFSYGGGIFMTKR